MKSAQSSKNTGRAVIKAWKFLGEDFNYESDRYVPESKAKQRKGETSPQDSEYAPQSHRRDDRDISESRAERAALNLLAVAPDSGVLESIGMAYTHPVSQ